MTNQATLLNDQRPPVFCPGCSHDKVLKVLDQTFINMGLKGEEICMVSDIGCSGLFDTFFHTHAFHGLHGRALTYAQAMKLCRPDLNVVVTMGDGGLGIGGAHLLAACRRNVDVTLLLLNNFNFGMTGGQCSATTPNDAVVGSGFLNQLDKPLDLQATATAAGAPYVSVTSAYQKDLTETLEEAINYKGFSVIEVQGICPGRYTKRNKISPKSIDEAIEPLKTANGEIEANKRPEYGDAYRRTAGALPDPGRPMSLTKEFTPPGDGLTTIMLLGAAGQRAITAGELGGLAAISAGLQVTQKNEYNITVLRGPSITELILSPEPIDYTGIKSPDLVLAISPEGVERRQGIFGQLSPEALVIQAAGVDIPDTKAEVRLIDFKGQGFKKVDWALASMAVLAKLEQGLTLDMLNAAIETRFKGKVREASLAIVEKVQV